MIQRPSVIFCTLHNSGASAIDPILKELLAGMGYRIVLNPEGTEHLSEHLNRGGPIYHWTHHPASYFYQLGLIGHPDYRFVFLRRDPRDVLVSWSKDPYIPLRRDVAPDDTSRDRAILLELMPSFEGSMQCASSWMQVDDSVCMKLRFEVMKQSISETVRQVFRFVGLTVDETALVPSVRRHSFEAVSGRKRGEDGATLRNDYMVRKGTSGDWKLYFDDELKVRFHYFLGTYLRSLGYEEGFGWLLPEAGERSGKEMLPMPEPLCPNEIREWDTGLTSGLTDPPSVQAQRLAALYRNVVCHPDIGAVHLRLGIGLLRHADFETALEALRTAVNLDPGCGIAYRLLASLLRANGRATTAVALLMKALSTVPGDIDVLTLLGEMLDEQGDHQASIACFDQVIRKWPASSVAKGLIEAQASRDADGKRNRKPNIIFCNLGNAGASAVDPILKEILAGIGYEIVLNPESTHLLFQHLNRTEPFYHWTHHPVSQFQRLGLIGHPNYKFIHLCRDPRDVLVSRSRDPKNYDSEAGWADSRAVLLELLKNYEEDLVNACEWRSLNDRICLKLRFETMKEDIPGAVRQIFRFLDLPLDEVVLDASVRKHSFETVSGRQRGEQGPIIRTAYLVRKGITGDWKNYFDAELKVKFHYGLNTYLHLLGYEDGPSWLRPDTSEEPEQAGIPPRPEPLSRDEIRQLTTADQKYPQQDSDALRTLITSLFQQVSYYPEMMAGHLRLAVALLKSGDLDTALEALRAAIAIDPSCSVAYRLLATLLDAQNRGRSAIALLEGALGTLDSDVSILALLGILLEKQGEYEACIPYLERVTRLNPDDSSARHSLGRALFRTGRTGEAEEALQLAHALDPFRLDIYDDLSALYLHMGRPDRVLIYCERALRFAPNHPRLVSQCASALEALGDVGAALEMIETSLEECHNPTLEKERARLRRARA